MNDNEPNAERRAKRQKTDKHGRGAAFERLKELKTKGVKHKYEVSDIDNVYDTVDEKEYSKKVLQRQDDDWIVDDGTGYVEDGREIFDEDLDEESLATGSSSIKSKKRREMERLTSDRGNLRNCLANMALKRKAVDDVKCDEDNVLSDILSEISSDDVKNHKRPETIQPIRATKSVQEKTKPAINSFRELDSDNDAVTEYRKKMHTVSRRVVEVKTEKTTKYASENKPESTAEMTEEMIAESMIQDLGDDFFDDDFGDSDVVIKKELSSQNCEKSLDVVKIKQEPVDATNSLDQQEMDNFTSDDFNDSFDEWNKIEENLAMTDFKQQARTATKVEEQNMDELLQDNDAGNKVFRFFWWDAVEDPYTPGTVYLFGKTKWNESFISCCVIVKNIERQIFLLPRQYRVDPITFERSSQPVTITDVYNEFTEKFAQGATFRSRTVTKKYCFALTNIPRVSEYLEVRLPSNHQSLKSEIKGETFEHIFGTNTSFLELLVLTKKLRGPCWLDLKNPEFIKASHSVSWCRVELICNNMNELSISQNTETLALPPLTLMTLSLTTWLNKRNMQNEIIMSTTLVHNQFLVDKPNKQPFTQNLCAITKPSRMIWSRNHLEIIKNSKVDKFNSETELLRYLLKSFEEVDPDIIVGHDLVGYQLDILHGRLRDLKIGNWSAMGKLKRIKLPSKCRNICSELFAGRLMCDLKISAKELIKARSFDFDTLCRTILKSKENERRDIKAEEIEMFFEADNGLKKLIGCKIQDSFYLNRMMIQLNVVPLALQITNVSGFVMSRTLLGGRAERNEFLLLHAFEENGYILPDKEPFFGKHDEDTGEDSAGKKKAKYLGGLVLEPKVNFYDSFVLLMDFNSLYPSIIQEYNLCFTTVTNQGERISHLDGDDYDDNENKKDLNCHNDQIERTHKNRELGILPTEIRRLVESRRAVKALMKDASSKDLQMQFNIKQMALKLTANSMYGCLGYVRSRFYAQHLAAKITELGRDILLQTKSIVENLRYTVIYGDTDSLMILTNANVYEEVLKIGFEIKKKINQQYRFIELDIDGVFKYLLLLKKKKYAAVTVTKKNNQFIYEQEIKGLDIVRRDWCQLAAEAGKFILNNILSDMDEDDKARNVLERLRQIKEDLEQDKVPVPLLSISKQLTRDPLTYANRNSLPHVLVAIRYNETNAKALRQGDTVYYVICEEPAKSRNDDQKNEIKPIGDESEENKTTKKTTKKSAMQRAYHVEEYKNKKLGLKVDVNYYLSQQIYPLVFRLCEPVSFLNKEQIAACLGLDVKVKHIPDNQYGDNYFEIETKYAACDPFTFKCNVCGYENVVSKIFSDNRNTITVLERCASEECTNRPVEQYEKIGIQLELTIRRYIKRHTQSTFVCDDPACAAEMDYVNRKNGERIVCLVCNSSDVRRSYSEVELHEQVSYFYNLFKLRDLESIEVQNAYMHLEKIVLKFLNQSQYNFIDLKHQFAVFRIEDKMFDNDCDFGLDDVKVETNELVERATLSKEIKMEITDTPETKFIMKTKNNIKSEVDCDVESITEFISDENLL